MLIEVDLENDSIESLAAVINVIDNKLAGEYDESNN